jgi:hypothetical protein
MDEDHAQHVAIKRLSLEVVTMELENGSNEDLYKEIWRIQTIVGDNHHVVGCIEALQDEQFLYTITP